MSLLDTLFGLANRDEASSYGQLFGERAGRPLGYYPDARPFPTDADAEEARHAGFGYDKPHQSLLRGERAYQFDRPGTDYRDWTRATQAVTERNATSVGDDGLRNAVMQGQLAANRSPLAALGFDPSKVAFDMKSGKTNIGGAYLPDRDVMYANPVAAGVNTIVHESIHRGVDKLRRQEDFPTEIGDWLNKKVLYKTPSGRTHRTDMGEMATRYLMFKAMGNPEPGAGDVNDAQIDHSLLVFSTPENLSYLMELERLAAQAIKSERPYGGPR